MNLWVRNVAHTKKIKHQQMVTFKNNVICSQIGPLNIFYLLVFDFPDSSANTKSDPPHYMDLK